MSMSTKVIAVDAQNALAAEREEHPAHWKGFVAGVFSGVAKLTGLTYPLSL